MHFLFFSPLENVDFWFRIIAGHIILLLSVQLESQGHSCLYNIHYFVSNMILISIGHADILKWLLDQKECSGNERDYYQSTPLHDAAEHGHMR